ncbi:hypothetical protein [Streptomyces sp. NEAU-S7GS2]|nr:hypothetical protein [Streptomyces sp. NEAU-S7GS2]
MRGALRAVVDARSIAERLDKAQGADIGFGHPSRSITSISPRYSP